MLGRGVVSAGVPGIATQQSSNAEPTPLQYTVFCHNFTGIIGATGGKPASRRKKRAN